MMELEPAQSTLMVILYVLTRAGLSRVHRHDVAWAPIAAARVRFLPYALTWQSRRAACEMRGELGQVQPFETWSVPVHM